MIGKCDICRYGQTDKCMHPNRENHKDCFVSHSGTTIAEKNLINNFIEKADSAIIKEYYATDDMYTISDVAKTLRMVAKEFFNENND